MATALSSASRASCSSFSRTALVALRVPKGARGAHAVMKKLQNRKTGGFGPPSDEPASAQKTLGTFVRMPKGGLTHPLFEQDHPDELAIESFKPDSLTPEVIGTAMRFGARENEPYRIFGLPRNLVLEFRMLSKPCSVIRDVTLKAVDTLDAASVKPSRDTRVVFTGESGAGKSFALLQAVQYAISRSWLVLYIPRAIALVDSSSLHSYDARTQTYNQPAVAFQLLQRFLTVNRTALSELALARDHELGAGKRAAKGTGVIELIEMGTRDQGVATVVFEALLEELAVQTECPVLVAIDDFQALYGKTKYRDPQFEPIKSYHLSTPRLLLDYASGKKTFARGAILGATSTTNTTFPISLELAEVLSAPSPTSPTSSLLPLPKAAYAYTSRSTTMKTYSSGLVPLEVPAKLTTEEAAGVFEVWMKDRGLHSLASDELFLAKYTETSGKARDFVWRGLLGTLET
ncbi:hypothetical protein FIBSPDRAFT_871879 [Athelia psychrophila]|uniref:Small ribosomal subunit protein mS29 n=1 Tax=Athelia psychrophila TaxID=1759441 RepID=A0A166A034_9AGAM|nr:hypothetical protein FIBSPDRAFT_871879 [Fibularhizoctonia sp. CBS 109695]